MRITDSMLVERFLRMHQEIMERIEKASYQLSSGKKLRYPHENPADTSQILNLKRSISEMERFLDNVNEGKAWLGITESAFDKVEDYLKRVQELTISGANDDKDRDSRLAIAQELDEIFGELVDMGNTKSMNRYIFAGTRTDEPPFSKPEENTIKVKTAGAPASLEVTDAFSDFYQFATGKYRLFMKREGTDRIAVWLEDQSGERVQIDANGSDDSGAGSNIAADKAYIPISLTADGKAYGVFDTGRGVKITLNGVSISAFDTVKTIDFEYHAGGEVSYRGNDEEQLIQIGYHGFVAANVPGENVFKGSRRLLASQGYFEDLSEGTPWRNMNVPDGAEYQIKGTTHAGRPAGVAVLTAPEAIDFERLGNPESGVNDVVLHFNIADSSGNIVSSSITLALPASYQSTDEVVNALKALLDANSTLRDKVEVGSEGDHIVFYLVEPGANYLSVKETDSSGNVISYLGIGERVGSWGTDTTYTVSDKMLAKGVYLTASETFTLRTSVSITITAHATNMTPLYTVELVEPRFYHPITSGTTVNVSVGGTLYTWTAPSDIYTLDDLESAWNDSANWSGGATVPPVALVKEDKTHYRFVSLVDSADMKFEASGSDVLHVLGLAPSEDTTQYVVSHTVDMSAGEYSALVLSYDINTQANGEVRAHTDGDGGIVVRRPEGPFELDFSADSKLKNGFPAIQNADGTFTAYSQQETLKDLIDRVRHVFKGHVKGWIKDGRLYFEDQFSGESSFDLSISPASSNASSSFDRFFVAREGEGEDVFDIVRDIREAMKENIVKKTVDIPSEWKTEQEGAPITTELHVASEGDFKGDYNTTWNVRVDVMTGSSGVSTVENPGYTGFFAEKEYRITTSSVTISGATSLVLHRSNGEEVTITPSGAITISGSSTSVVYRLYLEDGDITSSGNTLIINGKGELVVETQDEFAQYDGINDIKYIKFDGSLKLSVDSASSISAVPPDEKTNLLVTVEDSQGRTVKKFIVTDPRRDYYVRDGVYLNFGAGQVVSGDSFTMKVGSGVERQIGRLKTALDQVLRYHTDIGARMERLQMAEKRYTVYKSQAEKKKAPLEDADVTEAATELQKAETALRAALLASTKLFSPTLLDFMR